MNKYYLLLVLIGVFCTQCESIDYVEIPFKTSKVGHIIVPLKVNGVDINAIFDTGAQGSSISNSDFINTGLKLQTDSVLCKFPFLHKGKEFTLPVTKPKKIGIGNIRSKEKLAFTVQPDNLNISLWGNDVINQFCWYFNFKTMKVIISVNPINIDTTYSIAIPYTDINRLKYCSIRSKNAVFKNIFIDTGGGAAVFNGNYYVVTLLLTTTTKTGDKITGRGKGMEVDKKPLNASSLEIKYNNYLPFYKDKAGVSIYSGLVGLVDRTSNSIYDDTETNGTIKIGYAKGLYSGLYLDTKKKILYIIP